MFTAPWWISCIINYLLGKVTVAVRVFKGVKGLLVRGVWHTGNT